MPNRNDIRISYIVSTRNRADFLDRALANVREFIAPEDELIVVDGASTDHTAQVIEKHRDIVSVFLSEPDRGEAHGFNKGMLASHGRYIKFLTDDDYIYPQAMHDAIAVMEQHPELDAVVCGGEMLQFDAATQERRLFSYVQLPPSLRIGKDCEATLRYINCGLGLILARKCLSLVGLLDTTFRSVDTDYIARLIACRADFRYLNVKLYSHTEYPHSGVRNRSECQRDAVRAYQRLEGWEQVMRLLGDDPTALADPWGLLELPGGKSLWKLIWCGENLRRSRLRVLLPLLVLPLAAAAQVARCCRRLGRKVGTGAAAASSPPSPPPEPQWDLTLR